MSNQQIGTTRPDRSLRPRRSPTKDVTKVGTEKIDGASTSTTRSPWTSRKLPGGEQR
ncbi:hypothetical protein LV779_12385 [Streptomyces thinghirensis]|nr:hypothetical protein [Streptomyces thinghirensis]